MHWYAAARAGSAGLAPCSWQSGGAGVTLVARNEALLEEVAADLPTSAGQRHSYLAADFENPDAVQAAVRDHLDEVGYCEILVNNTGGPPAGVIIVAEPDAFRKGFEMHLICNQLLAQLLVPHMSQAQFGRIINIISVSVKEPIPGLGVSNTIRWAVASWAKTLAGELGPYGITVNNVLPGYTDTQRLRSLIATKAQQAGVSEDQIEQAMITQVPARRFATPEEVAAAVGFLAQPVAAYVNGINLTVDGGRSGCL